MKFLTTFWIFATISVIFLVLVEGFVVSNNRGYADVQSAFFSPFRVIGKRSQFYGLFKKMRSSEVHDY